jgi:hypothetical protein
MYLNLILDIFQRIQKKLMKCLVKKKPFFLPRKLFRFFIDGGIRMGVITELCGNPGSGKSNLWFV